MTLGRLLNTSVPHSPLPGNGGWYSLALEVFTTIKWVVNERWEHIVKCALIWYLFSLWFCFFFVFSIRGADAILNGLTLDRIQTLRLSWWLSDKESASNVGDPGLTPGLGRSSGEENGNPLQYSCWKIPWTEEPGVVTVLGVTKSQTRLSDYTHTQDSDSNGLKSFLALLFEGQSQGSSSTWALTRNANLRPHSRLISSECTFYQDLQMMCAQLILEISLISHPLARSTFKESNVHTVTYDAIASQSFFLLSSVPQLSYTMKIKWTMEEKNGARSWTVF